MCRRQPDLHIAQKALLRFSLADCGRESAICAGSAADKKKIQEASQDDLIKDKKDK